MVRFICHLLGKPYETCKSCETLKEQLEINRFENQNLLNTILGIVKPVAVEQGVPIAPIKPKIVPWHIRRTQLEEKHRLHNKIGEAHPEIKDEIAKVEEDLGI